MCNEMAADQLEHCVEEPSTQYILSSDEGLTASMDEPEVVTVQVFYSQCPRYGESGKWHSPLPPDMDTLGNHESPLSGRRRVAVLYKSIKPIVRNDRRRCGVDWSK